MKDSFVKFCPVPSEQQPINEYEELKQSWFFGWSTGKAINYWSKLIWLYAIGWLIASPIAAASYQWHKHPVNFLLSAAAGAGILVSLIVLRMFLGWYYVASRLKAETISYEESGWYDGQTWQKPPEILARDRLIVSYQITPIFSRLKKTALLIISMYLIGGVIWGKL